MSVSGPYRQSSTFVAKATRKLARWALVRSGAVSRYGMGRTGLELLAPRGAVDWPKAGATVARGVVTVSGWAVAAGQPAKVVVVTVDGRIHASAHVDRQRVDVAWRYKDDRLLNSGFDVSLDLSSWPRSQAQITIAAQEAAGRPACVIGDFTLSLVDAPPIERTMGGVDSPHPGFRAPRGVIHVAGWAATDYGPADAVEVLVDGQSHGLARVGLPRQDLVDALKRPSALLAGFEHMIDLSQLPGAPPQVELEVRTSPQNGPPTVLGRVAVELLPDTVLSAPGPHGANGPQLRGQLSPPRPSRRTHPVRLLVVTHDLGFGGGQLYLSELLEKMSAGRSFPCTVVAPRDGPLRRRLERFGVEVHITTGYPSASADEYEGKVLELMALAGTRHFSHVLVNTLGAFIGADVGQRMELPVLWAVHESYPLPLFWAAAYPEGSLHPYVRARAEMALRAADRVIFEAEATRSLFHRSVPEANSMVIPYGVDNRRIANYCVRVSRSAARRGLGLPEDARVLLCLGTIEPRKGQMVLAEAFARRGSTGGQRTVLALVGDVGTNYGQELKRFVAWRGIADRVLVVPVSRSPYRWYRASDVLLSVADIESMPRSMLEAMSFALPIGAADVFGIGELLTDGETGFLVPAGRFSAVEALLTRVLTAPAAELDQMGQNAQVLVRRRHDSNGYADAYRRLLGA